MQHADKEEYEMNTKSTIMDRVKLFIYKHFEFDRVGERKVKKSIAVWHKGGVLNRARAKLMWNHIRRKYTCNIFPGITCGSDLRLEHLMMIAIGKTAILGNNVRIYSGVQIAAKVIGDEERKGANVRRHAKIGNNVILGNGCILIGPITIGDNCIIGARAIVTHDVPPNSVVIGTNQIRERREDENAPVYKKL